MTADPYKYFRPEARDIVDQFAQGVLELEKGASGAETIQRLLRLAHTLKGAARVVKQSEIAERAHAIEDTLSPLRERGEAVAREQIDAILAHLDVIASRLVTLAPTGEDEPGAHGSPAADQPARTVRADVAETDAVVESIAEAHGLLGGLRGTGEGLEQARHLAELLQAQSTRSLANGRMASPPADRRGAIAEELCRQIKGVERNLDAIVDRLDRELRQLREAAERLRLVSAGSLFVALERMARDTAGALGKSIMFEGKGGDIRLDAHVLETLQGALIQLVRNAVAHGIETQSARGAAGKPAAGRVCVTVSRRGRKISFECRDDGRGIDLAAVRRIAAQRGLIDPEAAEPDAQDLVRLLLGGGISTSDTVTFVAGRGIGLDVVREAVERLGGEVALRTEPGAGTTFELLIPPSLAAFDALLVEAEGVAGRETAAIVLDAVRGTIRLTTADISRGTQGATISYDGKLIPFLPLTAALDGAGWSATRNWTAIVVAGGGRLAAFGVDRALGAARIVARPLPRHLAASPIVVGAAIDAEGKPQLIYDPEGLVAAACGDSAGAAEVDPIRDARPILVIDDSPTTRMLEQSILEAAGYDVDVAISAEDGIEVLRRKRYALILVDVEMPGMDGFCFVERIRSDAAWRDIPAILVTSRAAPEDLQRGRDAGANGYIVKSEFDQAALLAMIGRLAG
jgi:two-component system chemotaxis sensor kinase CheA